MQECLEATVFVDYDINKQDIRDNIERIKTVSTAYIPDNYQFALEQSYSKAGKSFVLIEQVREASKRLDEYSPGYRPLHEAVRTTQKQIRRIKLQIETLDEDRQRLEYSDVESKSEISAILVKIEQLETERVNLEKQIPARWQEARAKFETLAANERKARQKYRHNADESYEPVQSMLKMIGEHEAFKDLQNKLPPMRQIIETESAEIAIDALKALEAEFNLLTNASPVRSKLSKARRALRGNNPDAEKAIGQLFIAIDSLDAEIAWRSRAIRDLKPELETYDRAIQHTIGMRLQQRLTPDQAENIASCLAVHKDISLYF